MSWKWLDREHPTRRPEFGGDRTGYQHLIEQYNLTQEKLSERIGKNRSTITNYLRLLRLPAPIQMALQNKDIDMGHARALLALDNPTLQIKLFQQIIQENLSVRKVEEW